MSTLSVIIPTYNEVSYIEDAVKSVAFADEIIVIDSFSTDGTKEKAIALGCKVLERKFDNFSSQKNHAIASATGDWVLFLDADERVTQKLKYEILSVIENGKHSGYKICFPHFYMNRFLYHKVDKVTRLVKNNNIHFTGDVHEKLHVEGSIGILKNFMIHYTYKGLFHLLQKKDSYAWFQANTSVKKGKKATYFHLFFKPFYRFFSSYILKRGFMDGVPGLALASINAYGVFSRYVKILLIEKGLK
ncbi:glycosyl transferase [Flavobacterium saliperosum S13]|uniref:Glycosyltransferase involved in cell wall bisynthesis n=2 Tax=Flavobacterium saliperosum TaxID=329186 RepID=A0A1G4VSA7_9FLAO|nr:glycosyltransferase family 2 protein [Flavobacterium saliperosum]ESU24030.1 glycosyl transferase [Flavobacterium saliperosum S13]SCX11141.1 Glycosyltransferase involved in cell wall bisynthesis [Flavobacterium saliperosum]